MRVRIALCAFTLLALAGWHLQPSLADNAPPPQAPQTAQVAPYAPPPTSRHAVRIDGLTPAQAAREADLVRWYAAMAARRAPKPSPRPARAERPPTPSAPIEAPSYDAGSIEALVCSIFVDSCGRAIRVFTCESGLNPSARNKSGASGVAQIMLPMHADMFEAHGWDWRDSWMDPYRNIIVAYDLSRAGTNWGPWVCK